MALPSKKSKININLDPPKVGKDYLEYGMERIEQLMLDSDKKTNYLPKTITFRDIDAHMKDFVQDGKIELIIDGKKVPVFYMENERWGEFAKTWKYMDGDKNVPTPYITVRRIDKKEGTRLGKKWAIPQGKAHKYLDVPIMDDGQVIYLRFKIPEPTNVDLIYDVKLFTKYRIDVNDHDKLIMNAFKSRQEYLYVKGNPMPIILEDVDEDSSTIKNIDGDRYYVSTYKFKVLAFIQDEREFEIVKTSRQPKFGIDLSSNEKRGVKRASKNISVSDDTINVTNSDNSFSEDILFGDYVAPDINVFLDDINSVPYPSLKDVNLEDYLIQSYAYPQLTQETTYYVGDEGWQLDNVWNDIYNNPNVNRVSIKKLEDFYTLKSPNQFGNTARFTTTGGTPAAMDGSDFNNVGEILYDNYLGLELIRVNGANLNWFQSIDFARSYGDGSWNLPTKQIYDLLWDNNIDERYKINNVLFSGSGNQATSTTHVDDIEAAYYINMTQSIIASFGKNNVAYFVYALYKPLPVEDNTIFSGTTQPVVTGETLVTYNYPILSQETSYVTGDEGWQRAFLFNPIYSFLSGKNFTTVKLIDFYTLDRDNIFGNRLRFTDSGGTDTTIVAFGETIYDHYLGVEFAYIDNVGSKIWDDYLSDCMTYDDGSWYPVPVDMMLAIIDHNDPLTRFNEKINLGYLLQWTCTTVKDNITEAYTVNQLNGSKSSGRAKNVATPSGSLAYRFIEDTTYSINTLTGDSAITITNTDLSYSATTATDIIISDITITDFAGITNTYPAAKDIDLNTIVQTVYAYPRLTQETSYRTGDEGWQLANVWNTIYSATTGNVRIVGLLDLYTLDIANQFGNYFRYTLTGGSEATVSDFQNDLIIYDNYLGIQIKRFSQANFVNGWNDAIDLALTFDDGTWYLPPAIIYAKSFDWEDDISIDDNGINKILTQTGDDFWMATTDPTDTTTAFRSLGRSIQNGAKTFTGNGSIIAYKPIPTPYTGSTGILVKNSDDSYVVTASTALILPDITITDLTGGTTSYPSVKDVAISAFTTPIEYTYAYPMLTQNVSYRTGDEGWQLENIWNDIYTGATNNGKAVVKHNGFYTLDKDNIFGNKLRFTLSGGTEPATNGTDFGNGDIIYDHYLGIQLIRLDDTIVTWDDYIDGTIVFDDGSWYPAPIIIWSLLHDSAQIHDANFSSNFLNKYMNFSSQGWSSSTRSAQFPTSACRYRFNFGVIIDTLDKTTTQARNLAYKPIGS